MRASSIRARVLYLAIVYALVLVGAVTVGTYYFVASGMQRSAQTAVWRLSRLATSGLAAQTRAIDAAVAASGLTDTERGAAVHASLRSALPQVFLGGDVVGASYALYEADPAGGLRLLWGRAAETPDVGDAHRRHALSMDTAIEDERNAGTLFSGLLTNAELGEYVIHSPVDLPGGGRGVLDVVYQPLEQEAVLDATRAPMLAIALIAGLASVIMLEIVMGWVLSLVSDVRKAADAINEGELCVHLPEEGDHEVSDLARSLNRVIDRLCRRAESQTRFVADASHELATPVAGIRGYVNILRDWGAEDPETRDEAIAAIDRESQRMARLCGNLLSMIRDEEVGQQRCARYDLNAASREVLALAATRYMDKRLEFIGPDDGPLWVVGDAERFAEALGIIVDNAAKYTLHGSVSVTTSHRRDKVVVEVADTGVGIPPEDMPNVFDRFYRSDASRSKDTGGFGLGLAIVKGIIDRAGGTISVTSTVGVGTTFHIELPRNRAKE